MILNLIRFILFQQNCQYKIYILYVNLYAKQSQKRIWRIKLSSLNLIPVIFGYGRSDGRFRKFAQLVYQDEVIRQLYTSYNLTYKTDIKHEPNNCVASKRQPFQRFYCKHCNRTFWNIQYRLYVKIQKSRRHHSIPYYHDAMDGVVNHGLIKEKKPRWRWSK